MSFPHPPRSPFSPYVLVVRDPEIPERLFELYWLSNLTVEEVLKLVPVVDQKGNSVSDGVIRKVLLGV